MNAGVESRTLYIIYLFPPIYFMAGAYLGRKYYTNDKVLIFVLFAFVLMYAAYDLGQILYSVFKNDGEVLLSRQILDEEGNKTRNATGYAIVMSVLIAGIAFIFSPKHESFNRWFRLVSIFTSLLALYGMIMIVTRTSVVEALVVLVFSLYMALVNRYKKNVALVVLFAIIVLMVYASYVYDISSLSNIVEAFEERNSNDSNVSQAGGRTELWTSALESLIHNPLGTSTGRTNKGTYCHNMWLDVGVSAGWLPFLILLFFSLNNIRHSFRLLKNPNLHYYTRIYFFAMFIVLILSCFVEPVLDNVYRHFLVYVFFCGIVSEMTSKGSMKTHI